VIALAAGGERGSDLSGRFRGENCRASFIAVFGGFGAAGSEIDAAAVTEIRRSQSEQALGKFFSRSGMKLRSMRKSDLRRLLGHGAADFGDSVTDADDSGLAGSVKKAAAVGRDDPATVPTNCNGIGFLEIAGEKARCSSA